MCQKNQGRVCCTKYKAVRDDPENEMQKDSITNSEIKSTAALYIESPFFQILQIALLKSGLQRRQLRPILMNPDQTRVRQLSEKFRGELTFPWQNQTRSILTV